MLDLYAEYVQLAGEGDFEFWTKVAAKELLWCRLIIKAMGARG